MRGLTRGRRPVALLLCLFAGACSILATLPRVDAGGIDAGVEVSTAGLGRTLSAVDAATTTSAAKRCKPGYTYLRKKCQKCAAGTFKKASGNGHCAHCAGNTYSKSGATKCRACPRGHVTAHGHTACAVRHPPPPPRRRRPTKKKPVKRAPTRHPTPRPTTRPVRKPTQPLVPRATQPVPSPAPVTTPAPVTPLTPAPVAVPAPVPDTPAPVSSPTPAPVPVPISEPVTAAPTPVPVAPVEAPTPVPVAAPTTPAPVTAPTPQPVPTPESPSPAAPTPGPAQPGDPGMAPGPAPGPDPNALCGDGTAGTCADGTCCSIYGYCGTGCDFCCVAYFTGPQDCGGCTLPQPAQPTCGAGFTGVCPDSSQCCSEAGDCTDCGNCCAPESL